MSSGPMQRSSRYPDRYRDKRGEHMWAEVLDLLAQYQQQKTERTA